MLISTRIKKYFIAKRALRARFENSSEANPYSYKQAKEELLDTIIKWRVGKYEKYLELLSNKSDLEKCLLEGGNRARSVSDQKMQMIRKVVGLD